MNKRKTTKRKKREVLSAEEFLRRSHIRDIRTTMENIGFHRITGIEGKEIVFKGRSSEFDDFFIYENLLLVIEYTSTNDVSTHLLKKRAIYDLIDQSHLEFVEFAINEPKFASFKEYYEREVKNKYRSGQIHIRILYCSIKTVDQQYKQLLEINKSVFFYDYDTVHYFKLLSATIKRSSRYELFHFLSVKASDIGNSVSDLPGSDKYKGNILPVEKSFFEDGHNIISFYIFP